MLTHIISLLQSSSDFNADEIKISKTREENGDTRTMTQKMEEGFWEVCLLKIWVMQPSRSQCRFWHGVALQKVRGQICSQCFTLWERARERENNLAWRQCAIRDINPSYISSFCESPWGKDCHRNGVVRQKSISAWFFFNKEQQESHSTVLTQWEVPQTSWQ